MAGEFSVCNLTADVLSTSYAAGLKERFLKYVRVWSESDSNKADAGVMPSAERERDMAAVLKAELEGLGLEAVQTDANCYTYARLPASSGCEKVPAICLMAHIDTVDEVSGKDVKPLVHEDYRGGPIALPAGITLDPEADKHLAEAGQLGDTIISSDGSTLLGADDKAGVAEIMTAVEFLVKHPDVKHGVIEVMFSPDEETGHGMDRVPLKLLQSKQCYTVDGGHEGELEVECFNAFKSDIHFTGRSKHTGDARPDMVNAIEMAASFVANLPHGELPETTDGYQGFFAPMEISGGIETADVTLFLRDFSTEGMDRRKKIVDQLAATTALVFGGKADVVHTQQYLNMKAGLDRQPEVTEKLVRAYRAAGLEPVFKPIRGGTDGSRLTEMGIPTPNIFTGGHSYHSRYEWASLKQMIRATEVLIQLVQAWVE